MYTSQWLDNDKSSLKVHNKFSDDSRDIIQDKGDNIVNYFEVIKAFTVNNEKIIQFIKNHAKKKCMTNNKNNT